ncbi:MAG: hypothetical protein ACNA8W_03315 [Bradymonadaceae bacterium]
MPSHCSSRRLYLGLVIAFFGSLACNGRAVDAVDPAEIQASIEEHREETTQRHQTLQRRVRTALDEAAGQVETAIEEAGERIEEIIEAPGGAAD